MKTISPLILVTSLLLHGLPAGAQEDVKSDTTTEPLRIDPLVITAERGYTAVGSAAIRELDLRLRPRDSSQELLRLVPGLVIAQHGGGGKAEQIFLRGFDADHGTDVAISVDGLPVNMVSHAHGQGYADLHFLIPEVVERIEVRKGPFDPEDGDFATAGAVEFRTREGLDAASLTGSFGNPGSARLVGMVPARNGGGQGYLALMGQDSRGPFELDQDHRRGAAFARWTRRSPRLQWTATASAYAAEWNASGQIPERAVRAGRISRFGAVDSTEGGRTSRYDASITLRSGEISGPWRVQAYLTRYAFGLFSNFTFFLEDEENGDGIEQVDARTVAGFRGSYGGSGVLATRGLRWKVGAGTRTDVAEVALHRQADRRRLSTRVDAAVLQSSGYTFAGAEVDLTHRLRLHVGLRGDLYRFHVSDRLGGGRAERISELHGIVSPKANLAFRAGGGTTLYASLGSGFHSNDARDLLDPARGARVLPRAVGAEVGARRSWGGGTLAASIWRIDLESELVYVGDEGTTEVSGPTRRAGVDLEARFPLLRWLWGDVDLNLSRGRFVDAPAGADRIPLAPTLTSTGGLRLARSGPIDAGIRYRFVGARPAREDARVIARGHALVELSAGYRVGRGRLFAVIDNLLNAAWNEAQFDTESRLRHEPEAVSELHFTPGDPRRLQVGIELRL